MVRSLIQWTKTLSFPARISPQKHQEHQAMAPQRECSVISSPTFTDNIYPDPDSEKAIMGSVVYCIHHKEGCKWTGELRKLKAHLNTCKHDAVPCTNKCGAQIPRVLMEDHLKYTCPQRRARCEFCGKDFTGHTLEVYPDYLCFNFRVSTNDDGFTNLGTIHQSPLFEWLSIQEVHERKAQQGTLQFGYFRLMDKRSVHIWQENHTGSCGFEPIYCENKCGMKVQRRHLTQHKAAECSKRLVPCRYCSKEFVADTLQVHHTKCGCFPVTCPNHCDASILAREDLDSHLKDKCPILGMCCPFKDAGCRFKGNRFALEKHVDDNTKQHLMLMCSVVTKQQHQIASLKSALSRLSLNYSGTLIWRISDYTSKLNEAKTKEGMELVSPPFYTSQYGYKLQASVFLNGNGAGESSHISAYIKILPGEYDALLRWPFSHSVSFTLFDQSNVPEKACNIVESFMPDPTWKNFQRPSKEPDSLGFGFPRFVSHEMLKKRHFLKDDTMFIRVKVDPSKIVAV